MRAASYRCDERGATGTRRTKRLYPMGPAALERAHYERSPPGAPGARPRSGGTQGFDRGAARFLRWRRSRDPHRRTRAAEIWCAGLCPRSEEHTSEHKSLMRISYAVFCLKKKKEDNQHTVINPQHANLNDS